MEDTKRNLVVKLTNQELGDLITCIGTCILFLTRYGLLAQRHRAMKVRDLVWNQVRCQLVVKPNGQGDQETVCFTYSRK